MTWDELDSLQAGQEVRRQKDLVGHRWVATLVRNALAKDPLSEPAYIPLPAVDAPKRPAAPAINSEYQARMKEKYGDLLMI